MIQLTSVELAIDLIKQGRVPEEGAQTILGRDCSDPLGVRLALNHEVYPFHNPSEMRDVLQRVAQRFPEHAPRCDYLIGSRPAP